MSDSLTNYLVGRIKSTTPCVIKYVPYGALVEVGIRLAWSLFPNISTNCIVGDAIHFPPRYREQVRAWKWWCSAREERSCKVNMEESIRWYWIMSPL